MQKRPRSVSVTLIFIAINALIWLVLGVLIALHAHPALPSSPLVQGLMAFLSFAMAGALFGLFFLHIKRIRIAYFLTLGLFVIITIAFVFDEFGWIDLLALLMNLVPIALLIKDRAWYLQR
jgi:hypothetical protein